MYTRWIALFAVFSATFLSSSCGGEEENAPALLAGQALTNTTFQLHAQPDAQKTPEIATNGSKLLAVWSDATGVFGTRIDATDGTKLDTNPIALGAGAVSDVDVTALGSDFLVVWSRAGVIEGRTVSDTGALGGPLTIAAAGTDPEIASSNSNYIVTWVAAGEVKATVLDATGTSVTNGGFTVASVGGSPSVASNGTSFLATWVTGGSPNYVHAQRFSAMGTALDAAPVLLSSSGATTGGPSATYSTSGYFVAWPDSRGVDVDIFGAYVDAVTGARGSVLPIAAAAGDQSAVSVSSSGSIAVITFVSGDTTYYNRFDGTLLDGAASTNGMALSTATPAAAPDVAAWTDRFAAVWVQQDSVWVRSPVEEVQTAPGALELTQSSVTVSESAGALTVTVRRTGGTDGAVTVDYATSAGTAAAGSDFTSTTGTLSWGDGQDGTRTFDVPILGDESVEGLEQFSVSLSNPSGDATLGTARLDITIEDDDSADPGTIEFGAASLSVVESGGQIVVRVLRNGGTDGPATVTYTTADGTATSGADYAAETGVLDWGDGQGGVKSFVLGILNDDVFEADETLTVTLSGVTGAALGATKTTTITIVEDDQPMRGMLGFEVTSHSADESDANVTLTVERQGGDDGAVSVDYATRDVTATAGADYDAKSGTLNWADGDRAAKTITVPLRDDTTNEGSETFEVTLSNITGGATLGSATAVVAIGDDEGPSRGSISVERAAVTVDESRGTVVILVNRAGGSDGPVSVEYTTIENTAVEGVDYEANSGRLNWQDGDSSNKSVTIKIIDDADLEPSETFSVEFFGPTGGATLAGDVATITIEDDEQATPATIGFEEANYAATEEEALASLFVTRTGGAEGEVTAQYETVAGTAGNGDFTAVSGRVRWADGDTSPKRIDVPLTQDSEDEDDETITVVLSEVTGGAELGQSIAIVTILDDDGPGDGPDGPDGDDIPGKATFLETDVTVMESDGTLTVEVERVDGSGGEVSVTWSTVGATALASSDFEADTGTLTWADGESGIKSFEVVILDDETSENSQQFWVTLTNPTEGLEVGEATLTVTIEDDDERDIPPLGSGSGDGCGGCSSGQASPDTALFVMLGGLFLARRRRR